MVVGHSQSPPTRSVLDVRLHARHRGDPLAAWHGVDVVHSLQELPETQSLGDHESAIVRQNYDAPLLDVHCVDANSVIVRHHRS